MHIKSNRHTQKVEEQPIEEEKKLYCKFLLMEIDKMKAKKAKMWKKTVSDLS